MPTNLKRDNVIKHIRLTNSSGEIVCRIGKKPRVGKPVYLKKT